MRNPQQFIRTVLKAYSFLFHRTYEVSGNDQLPHGAKIIAMNHTVGHDPIHLIDILEEPAHFLMQDGLFEIPIIGDLLKESGQIPVYRGTERAVNAMTQACALLRQGKTIAIFPEGKNVAAGERIRAKTGVVKMAIETGVPIIPLGLYVPPESLTALNFNWHGSKRCGAWQFSGKSYLRFGPTWNPNPQTNAHALTDELMDRIYSLVDESRKESKCASHTLLNPILQW